ncbi:MAG: hypothetical protein Q7U04_13520 [Bacteriovorax sp.]|nr:hypothetical protein [Bacteriovorax sp.]
MKFSVKKILFFISSIMIAIFTSVTFAEEPCAQCGIKEIQGTPKVSINGLEKIALMAEKNNQKKFNYDDTLEAYCSQYTRSTNNLLYFTLEDLNKSPYALDSYLKSAKCRPQKVGGIKSPVFHLTAEAPCSRVTFPEIIYDYFMNVLKNKKLWLEVVNSKNTAGETYLDYIETLNDQDEFNTVKTKECASTLVAFACSHGAIYSKYINKSCSTGI